MKNVEVIQQFYRVDILKLIFRRLMAEKRKSTFKCPHRCRRNRTFTPVPDLLSPYLLGPELFISPPMLTIQTRPVYSTARSDSSLNSVSPFIIGYSPSTNPMASFDLNLIPSSSGPLYTESSVVEDLSVRLTAQPVLPQQLDRYGPSSPVLHIWFLLNPIS